MKVKCKIKHVPQKKNQAKCLGWQNKDNILILHVYYPFNLHYNYIQNDDISAYYATHLVRDHINQVVWNI